MNQADTRTPLPMLPTSGPCVVCGEEPHEEECPVPEHEAMLAGDKLAQAIHDPEECPLCLTASQVCSSCRCGHCCEGLIIEASAYDTWREPRIRERGSPITEGGLIPLEQANWLLNGLGGPCVFFHRDQEGRGVCEIYETRPLGCRHFDCDHDERMAEYRPSSPPRPNEKGALP